MIDIIAHRGFWRVAEQKNSVEAFRYALENNFGIETDLRDFNGEVVISHDIPNKDSMTFKEFISIVREYEIQTLALNIKSDGLQTLVRDALGDYLEYFCFDMSVPDALGYDKADIKFYTRFSDIELTPSLLTESSGVWLDNFSSHELNVHALDRFLTCNKHVILVSPELHGYEYQQYWRDLLEYIKKNLDKSGMIGLCTDKPNLAREFFANEE